MRGPLVIAIDGPAASGKGTLARKLAEYYGLKHLDTGLTYRAVAALLMAEGGLEPNGERAVAAAGRLDLSAMDRDLLSAHDIGEAASKIAVIPELRQALVERQRAFASQPPGAVLDGRDIGTVVCPRALTKLYVTASPEVRARRRTDELLGRGKPTDFAAVLADLKRRDARDMERDDSPLRPADDAHLIDTSAMTIEAAFRAAVAIVDAAISAKDRASPS
ncbi:(d)CMP kinase [Afifella pfennigii]|uniref:(d)CMP kinase n=1 Tax=Afifella pfennigii TaxID=209897 RepID=UPI000A6C73FF|nr:(d)CMP kinase [Afifella pfennigii]